MNSGGIDKLMHAPHYDRTHMYDWQATMLEKTQSTAERYAIMTRLAGGIFSPHVYSDTFAQIRNEIAHQILTGGDGGNIGR